MIESLKTILENNLKAIIITNHGVGKILTEMGSKFIVPEENKSINLYEQKIYPF